MASFASSAFCLAAASAPDLTTAAPTAVAAAPTPSSAAITPTGGPPPESDVSTLVLPRGAALALASTLALALASSFFALAKSGAPPPGPGLASPAAAPRRRRDRVPGAPQLLRPFPFPAADLALSVELLSVHDRHLGLAVVPDPAQRRADHRDDRTGPRGYPRPSALLIVNRLAGPLAWGARPFVRVGRGGLFVARETPFDGAEPGLAFGFVFWSTGRTIAKPGLEAGGLVAAFAVVAGEATGPGGLPAAAAARDASERVRAALRRDGVPARLQRGSKRRARSGLDGRGRGRRRGRRASRRGAGQAAGRHVDVVVRPLARADRRGLGLVRVAEYIREV